MGSPKPSVFIAILVVAASASLRAQNSQVPPPDPVRFDTEIVVTPERGETPRNRVPASTIAIEGTALAELPIVHPSEVVSFLPGFNIARPQAHMGRPVVTARGFFGGGEAEYILLLVDGVPAADVESGLIDWSVLPVSSIRRIEAFRGPGASSYGDSAVGGVIQILTDRESSGGRLTALGGSFNTMTADGSYGRRSKGFGFDVSGAARRTGGGLDHSNGQQVVGTGSADGTVRDFAWRWQATGDNRNSDDPGVLTREQSAIDPYASDPLFRFDTLDRRSFSTAFTLRHPAPRWRPHARVYARLRDEDLVRTILLAPELGDRRARSLSSAAVGGSFEGEHEFSGAKSLVRFGLDLSREHLDTSYRSVSPAGAVGARDSAAEGHRTRAGLFVSSAWDVAPRVRISGAIRRDDVSDSGFGDVPSAAAAPRQTAWSPRVGAVFQLTPTGLVLYTQVSRAFKAPTLDQLFDPRPYPDFMGGTFTISNRDLVPQRATNLEVGLSGGGRVRWSALAYRMAVEDEIDFDVQTFSYGNVGRSRHVGVEIEAEGRWWTAVRPSVSYALSDVTNLDGGRQLKNVPRHLVTAAASIALPWSVSAYGRYKHTWGAFLDDENEYVVKGPSTLDFRLRRPVGRQAVFLDVLNVTGDEYEEYGYTLADFTGGVVPYAYRGAPRAVRAGVTLSF